MARVEIQTPADPTKGYTAQLTGYAREIQAAAKNFSLQIYQHTKLTLREYEGARARTAEINGCRRCQGWRTARDLPHYFEAFGIKPESTVAQRGPAPDEAYYAAVSEWRTSPLYSPRERTAIEYAERMGTDPQGVAADDEFWGRAKALFSDEEIVDLSYCIAGWMGLGRVSHVLGVDIDVCSIPEPSARPVVAA